MRDCLSARDRALLRATLPLRSDAPPDAYTRTHAANARLQRQLRQARIAALRVVEQVAELQATLGHFRV